MLISATWGLGSALAQGEVVPDRIALDRKRSRAVDGRRPEAAARPMRPRSRSRSERGSDKARLRGQHRGRAGRGARRHAARGGENLRRPGRDRVGAGRAVARSFCRRARCVSSPRPRPIRSGFSTRACAAIPPGSAGARAAASSCAASASSRASGRATFSSPRWPVPRLARCWGEWRASSPSSAARRRTSLRSPASEASRWFSACSARRAGFPTERRSPSTAWRASFGG